MRVGEMKVWRQRERERERESLFLEPLGIIQTIQRYIYIQHMNAEMCHHRINVNYLYDNAWNY